MRVHSLPVPVPSIFRATLDDIVKETAHRSPGVDLHSFLQSSAHLHISLAHPFPLRQSQIPEFKADLLRALRSLRGARTKGVFPLSLGGRLRVYYNGKKYGGEGHGGRAFLALRVSAGMKEVSADDLDGVLSKARVLIPDRRNCKQSYPPVAPKTPPAVVPLGSRVSRLVCLVPHRPFGTGRCGGGRRGAVRPRTSRDACKRADQRRDRDQGQ
jgi:hypothetical protein